MPYVFKLFFIFLKFSTAKNVKSTKLHSHIQFDENPNITSRKLRYA